MWYLPNKNIDFGLDIPPVCTSQPKQGCAFCSEHSDAAEKLGVPPSLQAFLKHCGVQGLSFSAFFCISILKLNNKVKNILKRSQNKWNLFWRWCTPRPRSSSISKMQTLSQTTLLHMSKVIFDLLVCLVWFVWLIVKIVGTRATLRPRGGILNSKKMTGTQDYEPTCNKDTTGIGVLGNYYFC